MKDSHFGGGGRCAVGSVDPNKQTSDILLKNARSQPRQLAKSLRRKMDARGLTNYPQAPFPNVIFRRHSHSVAYP